MAVNCVAVQALTLNTSACLSELHFCPEYFLPQFSHIAVMGQQFFRHFGFFGVAQFGVVLLLSVEAVGGAALLRTFADPSGLATT